MTHPSAKPCLGYPSRAAAIVALHKQGIEIPEIARRIGGTPTFVSVTLSKARQSPRHRAALGDEAVVQLRVPQDTRRRPAGRRAAPRLVSRAAGASPSGNVATDRMADAVLDDRGGAA